MLTALTALKTATQVYQSALTEFQNEYESDSVGIDEHSESLDEMLSELEDEIAEEDK